LQQSEMDCGLPVMVSGTCVEIICDQLRNYRKGMSGKETGQTIAG
jgi:hypothetical protein